MAIKPTLVRFSLVLVCLVIFNAKNARAECFAASNPFQVPASFNSPFLDPVKSAAEEIIGHSRNPAIATLKGSLGAVSKMASFASNANQLCGVLQTARSCYQGGGSAQFCLRETAKEGLCAGSNILGLSANPFSGLGAAPTPAAGMASSMGAMIDMLIPLSSYNPFCNQPPSNLFGSLWCCPFDDPATGIRSCPTRTSSQCLAIDVGPSPGRHVQGYPGCLIYAECRNPATPSPDHPAADIQNTINHLDGIRLQVSVLLQDALRNPPSDGNAALRGSCSYNEFFDLLSGRGCDDAISDAPPIMNEIRDLDDLATVTTLRLMAGFPQAQSLWKQPRGSYNPQGFFAPHLDDCGREIFARYGWNNLPNYANIGLSPGAGTGKRSACRPAIPLKVQISAISMKSPPHLDERGVRVQVGGAANAGPVLAAVAWSSTTGSFALGNMMDARMLGTNNPTIEFSKSFAKILGDPRTPVVAKIFIMDSAGRVQRHDVTLQGRGASTLAPGSAISKPTGSNTAVQPVVVPQGLQPRPGKVDALTQFRDFCIGQRLGLGTCVARYRSNFAAACARVGATGGHCRQRLRAVWR